MTISLQEMTVQEKFERVHEILGKLEEIKKSPMKYALLDLVDFLEKDADKISKLVDDIEYDVKDFVPTRYSDSPDETLILREEHNQAIRAAVGM